MSDSYVKKPVFKVEMQKLTETVYKFYILGGTNLRAENSVGTNVPIIEGWNIVTSDTKLIIESDDLTTKFRLLELEEYSSTDDKNLNKLILHSIGKLSDLRYMAYSSYLVELIFKPIAVIQIANQITDIYRAWAGCQNLQSFPLLKIPLVTDLDEVWSNCRSLTSFPLIDTSNVTNMDSAWNYCNSLTSFPLLDTSNVYDISRAWNNCTSLTTFPSIDTSSVTDMNAAWWLCTSLSSFPPIDTSSVTNMNNAWQSCTSLKCIGNINTTSATSVNYTLHDTPSLIRPTAAEQVTIMDIESGGLDWINDGSRCYKQYISNTLENI